MSNWPLVSVIVPCYNAHRTLESTLNDIFYQTYNNIEIIAVNDGSTDATHTILERHSKKLTILNQENKGAPAARNAGFKISKGIYILFCDSDVHLHTDMVERMVETLESNPDASYCYSSFKFGPHTFDLFPFDPERLRKENYISTMSMIRREAFLGFDEEISRFQDWDLWKRMLDRGMHGIWYPGRLFEAPLTGTGISKFSVAKILKLGFRKLFS
ncbi:MAG: glycosyltransferase family A protein [Patescibacteria group bacterium]